MKTNFNFRMGRLEYVTWHVLYVLLTVFVFVVAKIFTGEPAQVTVWFVLGFIVFHPVISIPRLHDMNRPASWLYVYAIPPTMPFFFFWMAVNSGTPGTNDYGPPPVMRTAVIALRDHLRRKYRSAGSERIA